MSRALAAALAVATSTLATAASGAITLAVNEAIEYQQIEGFGAWGASYQQNYGVYYDQRWANLLLDTVGYTMVRTQVFYQIEETNDNADPFVTDLSRFSLTYNEIVQRWPTERALMQQAIASGIPLTFIGSVLSPPGWMKTNNSPLNGGHLRPEYYDEFAEFVIAFIRLYERETGIRLYAVSLENEPQWAQPYPSCQYTPQEYRDMMKVVGPRLEAAGLGDVRLFMAEDLLINWGYYEGVCTQDPACRAQIDRYAVHGYDINASSPMPSSGAATAWRRAYTNAHSVGIPLWMTETSGYAETWQGAMNLAQAIYAALKHGKVSAWLWYASTWSSNASTGLFADGGLRTMRSDVSRNYYRFIRPGATMVDLAVTGDTTVFAVAFNHKQDQTLTVVMVNPASQSKTVQLAGNALPVSMQRYVTTAAKHCVREQNSSAAAPLTLEPSSVTTLYGTGYAPPSTAAAQRPQVVGARHATCRAAPGVVHRYAVDGRVVTEPRAGHAEGRLRGLLVTVNEGQFDRKARALVVR